MSESKITKQAIARGFKTLLLKKDFSKISVSDIASQCGLNRQTFYYHFQDKYELLNWIYYQEAVIPTIDGVTFENWNEHLLSLFKIMKADEAFYIRTIRSEEVYLQGYLQNLTTTVFLQAIEDLDSEHHLDAEDKEFYARFYAYGVSGCIISWIYEGMKTPPEQLAEQLEKLVEDTEKIAYRKYREQVSR